MSGTTILNKEQKHNVEQQKANDTQIYHSFFFEKYDIWDAISLSRSI